MKDLYEAEEIIPTNKVNFTYVSKDEREVKRTILTTKVCLNRNEVRYFKLPMQRVCLIQLK